MVQNKTFSFIGEHCFQVCHTWAISFILSITMAQPFRTAKQGSTHRELGYARPLEPSV